MTDFVTIGDARIAYEAVGSGPALVLMHGAEASRAMFAAIVPLLARHFTVISYDQRDCGETQGPERASSLGELADDARALIDALGFERAHVFGSSFGGRVAQALVTRDPMVVDRLVLGSTWPLPESLAELNPEGVAQIGKLRSGLPDSAEALAIWFFPEPFLAQRPELRRFFAQVQPASERSLRRAEAVGSSLAIDFSAITAPTLLLTGDEDRLVPSALTLSMEPLIANSRQVVLKGVGHATALQAPDAVASRLVEFLTASS